jgi:hypothetical protein
MAEANMQMTHVKINADQRQNKTVKLFSALRLAKSKFATAFLIYQILRIYFSCIM